MELICDDKKPFVGYVFKL